MRRPVDNPENQMREGGIVEYRFFASAPFRRLIPRTKKGNGDYSK